MNILFETLYSRESVSLTSPQLIPSCTLCKMQLTNCHVYTSGGVNHEVSLHLSFRSTHLAWTGPGQGQLEGVTHPPTSPPHPLHTYAFHSYIQANTGESNQFGCGFINEKFKAVNIALVSVKI
jgi:hypothetical protein